MIAADRSVWFVGDLDDPWVASIAEALPAGSRRIACGGDLPDDWPVIDAADVPRVVVLHRALLTPYDAERVMRLRSGVAPAPRVVLCVGPHARHVDLERWTTRGIIDVVVPEATARDTIARHLAAAVDEGEGEGAVRRSAGPRLRVAVVGTNSELRRTLVDACEALGYPAEPARDWTEAAPTGPAVWDVPVLEPDWPRAVARRARLGPVVVLLGFPDRAMVGQARAHGASACLELPYDLPDLGHVLDRVASPRVEPAHAVPPPPSMRRRAGAARGHDRPQVAGRGPGA
jgi:CheY-like chemotaxis protein